MVNNIHVFSDALKNKIALKNKMYHSKIISVDNLRWTNNFVSDIAFLESEKNIPNQKTIDRVNENQEMKTADYLVAFSGLSKNYCVGLVDMVDSTKIMANLNSKHWLAYYSLFLNFVIRTLREYDAVPFKNGGDSILYYFPDSTKNYQHEVLKGIECSLKMVELHSVINEKALSEKLPDINYRISMDYGVVMIMDQNQSHTLDMIGPPVNMCSKINHHADRNQVVVGGDLYQIARNSSNFKFQQTKGHSVGLKNDYPVYLVTRKN